MDEWLWIYQETLAREIQWQLGSYEYINQLLEFGLYLNGTFKQVNELKTFWKYFQLDNPNQTEVPRCT